MKVRSAQAFTVVELLLAAVIVGALWPLAISILSTAKLFYQSAGFAAISAENIPYAPNTAVGLAADSVFAQLREDDILAAAVVGLDQEIAPSYAGSSGVVAPLLNATPAQLASPSAARLLLAGAGVPFSSNPGYSVLFLGRSAAILSIYRVEYTDTSGVRLYTVSRTGPSAPLLQYRFVEPAGHTQPIPTLALGVLAGSAVPVLQARFPDPSSSTSLILTQLDTITDPAQRTAAQAAILRPARDVFYLYFRR